MLIPPAPGQNGACQETPPPVQPTRRLTRDQYLATVRDLLGDTRDLSDRFPADDKGEAVFAPPDTLTVTPTWADKLLSSAEELAKTAMANPARLLPCNPSGNEDACADQFIKTFGKRAFRRPLNADDVAGLTAIYKTGAAQGGFASGIELVISTILQSPSFVYRVELGQKAGSIAGAVKLTPHEVASRLSYFIWGTMPDQLLFEAADAGKLTSAEDIGAQVERMMKDPRARTTLVGFNQRLFGTDIIDEASKDGEIYPQFTDEVKAAMKAEFQAYVEDALFAGDGSLDTLLTSKTTFVNAALASLYGVPAPGGTGLQKVQLDGTQRAGLLTTVGLLSAHTISDTSAPIIRGKFIRERLLCAELAEPPPGLEVVAPDPKPGITTRELLVQHATSPSCSACHELMDPIGFGYGNFDGIGRWRTTEEGKAVDASGRLHEHRRRRRVPGAGPAGAEAGQQPAGPRLRDDDHAELRPGHAAGRGRLPHQPPAQELRRLETRPAGPGPRHRPLGRIPVPPPAPRGGAAMSQLRFSRRTLFRSSLAIPAVALPVLRSSPLLAATPGVRLVVFYSSNGTIPDTWKPRGTTDAWEFVPEGILEPLAKFKPKLNLLWGVHYKSGEKGPGAGHQKGVVAALTGLRAIQKDPGYATGISVDQWMANKWGAATRFKTVEFGVKNRTSGNRGCISYLGANQPVFPENDPVKAYGRYFGNFTPPAGGRRPCRPGRDGRAAAAAAQELARLRAGRSRSPAPPPARR